MYCIVLYCIVKSHPFVPLSCWNIRWVCLGFVPGLTCTSGGRGALCPVAFLTTWRRASCTAGHSTCCDVLSASGRSDESDIAFGHAILILPSLSTAGPQYSVQAAGARDVTMQSFHSRHYMYKVYRDLMSVQGTVIKSCTRTEMQFPREINWYLLYSKILERLFSDAGL